MAARSFQIALVCALAVTACGAGRTSVAARPRAAGDPRTSSETWVPTPPPPLVTLPASAPVPEALDEPYRTRWIERLELGHPDPRHGVPHMIEIADVDTGIRAFVKRRVVGFVLPHARGDDAFAIVGPLVYRVVRMGRAVDLRALCTARLATVEPDDETLFRDDDPSPRRYDLCRGANAALFLASSDARLANAVAARFDAEDSIHRWAVSALHRALTAHGQGDDVIARHDAHIALRLLARRGDEPGYHEAARLMARDQDRRALAPRHAPFPSVPAEGEVPAELVPALIEQLDELHVELGGIGGFISLGHSPIVDALVRAGDAAVSALIDTIEHDERLTRTPVTRPVFDPEHPFLTVRFFAMDAVMEILGPDRPFQSRAWADVAQDLRAFWDRYGHVPPAERRFRMLADDGATPEQHLRAAHWLTLPERVRTGERLRGDSLRGRRTPSVSELIVRRMNAAGPGEHGCFLASVLRDWAPDDARALSVTFARRCIARAGCECAPQMSELLRSP